MRITIDIDTVEGVGDYERGILLALAGDISAARLADEDDAYRRGMQAARDAAAAGPRMRVERAEDMQADERQDHPGLHEKFARENAEAQAERDQEAPAQADTAVDDGLPRHPDGRIVGRAPEGKTRRTKAQIEEDEAYEAARRSHEQPAAPEPAAPEPAAPEQAQEPAPQAQAAPEGWNPFGGQPAPQAAPEQPQAAPQAPQQPATPFGW